MHIVLDIAYHLFAFLSFSKFSPVKREIENMVIMDEDAHNLFEVTEHLNSPEKRLLFAICERAVRDLFSSVEEERLAATDWFNDCEGNDAFSFPWICEVLDLNRKHLLSRIWSLYDIGINERNASREIYMLIDRNNEAEQRLSAA